MTAVNSLLARASRPRARWAAVPLLLAVLALAAGASGAGRYGDPTGDSGGAPDITGVSVASDANGQILFTIRIADLHWPAEVGTLLFLDTDLNSATGMPLSGGADYVFLVDESDSTYGFAHWTGADWDHDTPFSTVRVFSNRTGVTISVNRRELGDTGGFNFWVRTARWDAEDSDTAPDAGLFNYSLQADGPDIRRVLLRTTPASGPKAGRPFTVRPAGLQLPAQSGLLQPQPESFRCAATLAGRRLAGTGPGRCTLALPGTARGKQLVVVVTVVYQGATKSFRFAYRVV